MNLNPNPHEKPNGICACGLCPCALPSDPGEVCFTCSVGWHESESRVERAQRTSHELHHSLERTPRSHPDCDFVRRMILSVCTDAGTHAYALAYLEHFEGRALPMASEFSISPPEAGQIARELNHWRDRRLVCVTPMALRNFASECLKANPPAHYNTPALRKAFFEDMEDTARFLRARASESEARRAQYDPTAGTFPAGEVAR